MYQPLLPSSWFPSCIVGRRFSRYRIQDTGAIWWLALPQAQAMWVVSPYPSCNCSILFHNIQSVDEYLTLPENLSGPRPRPVGTSRSQSFLVPIIGPGPRPSPGLGPVALLLKYSYKNAQHYLINSFVYEVRCLKYMMGLDNKVT